MVDLSQTIAPKSDQLDAVDLLGGPQTFTVTAVRALSGDQPVAIDLAEFPRAYRPGLSMRRVLVACWGDDGKAYVGRRMTLYCDPTVKFGGVEVGGVRISHLSHLRGEQSVPLIVSRGKSGAHVVQALREQAPPPQQAPSALSRLSAAMRSTPGWDKARVEAVIDHRLTAFGDLTEVEAEAVLDAMTAEQDGPAEDVPAGQSGEQPTTEDPPYDADEDHRRAVEAQS